MLAWAQVVARRELGVKTEWLIGRSDSCALCIRGSAHDYEKPKSGAPPKDTVSRKHAKLTLTSGKVSIKDLGSTQGTPSMAALATCGVLCPASDA
jgi:pSer/pThr/pTyr-binding forkhead associated (FHA) protein